MIAETNTEQLARIKKIVSNLSAFWSIAPFLCWSSPLSPVSCFLGAC